MITIFTLVLDGEPFIERHLPVFEQLTFPWRWIIAEGAAMNVGSTKWCKPQQPRLSRDGTTAYLNSISRHPNVTVIQRQCWEGGKDQMVNACLARITEPCTLLQMDSDECWRADQLEKIHAIDCGRAYFFCRYFVGQNIVTIGEDTYGANPGEWLRVWKFTPGDTFLGHEPPVLKQQNGGPVIDRNATREMGLVFDHFAYALESQVAFKEQFYGYRNAVANWRRLQENKIWPAQLKKFLPWVDPKAKADLVKL